MADPSSLEDANNKDVKNCYSRATTAPVLLGVSVSGSLPPPPSRRSPPGRYPNIPARLSPLDEVAPGRSPPVPSRLSPPGRYPNIPSRLAPLGRPPLGLSPVLKASSKASPVSSPRLPSKPTSYETSNGLPRGLSPPGRYPNIPSRLSPRGLSPPGVAPGRSPPVPSRLTPPGRYPNIPARLSPLDISPPSRSPPVPSRLSPPRPLASCGPLSPLGSPYSYGSHGAPSPASERSPSAAWLDAKVVAPTVAPPAERSGRWGLRWSSIRQSS